MSIETHNLSSVMAAEAATQASLHNHLVAVSDVLGAAPGYSPPEW